MAEFESGNDGPKIFRTVILALLVVSTAIGLYVYLNHKPPVASVELAQVWIAPIHASEKSVSGMRGLQGASSNFDQVLLLAHVKLHNQSKTPIFLHELTTKLTIGNTVYTSTMAGAQDTDRAFLVYKQLAPAKMPALKSEIQLDPGQSAEGLCVFQFKIAKQEWDDRSALDLDVGFRYQQDIMVPFPAQMQTL